MTLKAKLGLLLLQDDRPDYAVAFVANLAVLPGHRGMDQLFLKALNLLLVTIGTCLGNNLDSARGRRRRATDQINQGQKEARRR